MDIEDHFIDFLAICGLDPTCGLEPEHFSSKLSDYDSRTPLERSYVAKVLSFYPKSRVDASFSHEILALCLPRGLRFATQKDVPLEPSFHNFACVKADGSRVDGSALTFYEPVDDVTVCQSMQYLHSLHVRDLTMLGQRGSPSHRSSQANASPAKASASNGHHANFYLAAKPPRPDEKSISKGGSNTLPRRGRSSRAAKRTSFYDSSKDRLYASKCVCVVTRLPIVGASEALLRALYQQVTRPAGGANALATGSLSVESLVYWTLYELPLPPPGRSLKLCSLDTDIVCQRPGINELPFFDFCLREMFELISPDDFLKIYTCVLLEHQVLLCSKVLQRLMLMAESLTSLLFPFRWQHVYVPILPYSQYMFLEAPLPFIMGLWYEENVPDEVLQSNICFVDIDSGRLELPEDVPMLPDRSELLAQLHLILDKYCLRVEDYQNDGKRGNLFMQNNDHYDLDMDSMEKSFIENQQDPVARLRQAQQRKERWMAGGKRSEYKLKRMSRSFDEDSSLCRYLNDQIDPLASVKIDNRSSGITAQSYSNPPLRSQLPPLPLNVLQESESLARLRQIVKKVGIDVGTIESLQRDLENSCAFNLYKNSPNCERYFEEMKLNNSIREIFLNRFVYMLFSYDHFIIGNHNDKDSMTSANHRDSVQNFDKASFLSDQPASHLPFLSAFLETQMFTSFIDVKILAHCQHSDLPSIFDLNIDLFDRRLNKLRQQCGDAMVCTPSFEQNPSFVSEQFIADRQETLDYDVTMPRALDISIVASGARVASVTSPDASSCYGGLGPNLPTFPLPRSDLMRKMSNTSSESPQKSPWKQRYKTLRRVENTQSADLTISSNAKFRAAAAATTTASVDLRAAEVAQTNWSFVEQLLREAKSKTKRILVAKMGKEAVQLGHTDLSLMGVEENTLVASMCDMVERIWNHGLVRKKGKSALWSHLLALQEMEKAMETGKLSNPDYLTPPDPQFSVVDPSSSLSVTPQDQQQQNLVVNYFQNLQKEMNSAVSSTTSPETSTTTTTAAPWSQNFLTAVNFICDKLQQQKPDNVVIGDSDSTNWDGRSLAPVQNCDTKGRMDIHSVVKSSNDVTTPSSGGVGLMGGFLGRLKRTGSSLSLLSDFSPWNGSVLSSSAAGESSTSPQSPSKPVYSTNSLRKVSVDQGFIDSIPSPAVRPSDLASAPATPTARRRSLSRSRFAAAFGGGGASADGAPLAGGALWASLLKPLPTHIAQDMRNVIKMSDIKTDIGFARAFVRLALERKLLHKHLKTLLSNEELLQGLYRRYAFLRCEEEREQLLCHVLSLNAADFHCFTNTFVKTEITYQVVVVPGNSRGGFTFSSSQHQSIIPLWIRVAGTLHQTRQNILLPKNSFTFTFDHKNLGILTTLRIGFDPIAYGNSSAKWFLDYVLIRNEVTGRTYKFPCNRWFGRGVDDGSLERLLVAEPLNCSDYSSENYKTCRTPPRSRSPSAARRGSAEDKIKSWIVEVHQGLGDAVNNIVKHFYKKESVRTHLTPLLCGDRGLVAYIEQAFLINIKSARLFKHAYPWDIVEKFAIWSLELVRNQSETIKDDNKAIIRYCVRLVSKLNALQVAGKEGKFQAFVLISLRDHTLPGLVTLISNSPIIVSMYDEPSFLRTPSYRLWLIKLLRMLNDFKFDLEESLTWGIKM